MVFESLVCRRRRFSSSLPISGRWWRRGAERRLSDEKKARDTPPITRGAAVRDGHTRTRARRTSSALSDRLSGEGHVESDKRRVIG